VSRAGVATAVEFYAKFVIFNDSSWRLKVCCAGKKMQGTACVESPLTSLLERPAVPDILLFSYDKEKKKQKVQFQIEPSRPSKVTEIYQISTRDFLILFLFFFFSQEFSLDAIQIGAIDLEDLDKDFIFSLGIAVEISPMTKVS
jgi:hypothetical protein